MYKRFSCPIAVSLAGKIIAAISVLFVFGGGTLWYTLINAERKSLLDSAIAQAVSHSDIVKRGIRHGMLTAQRDSVRYTLEHISSRKDIEQIKIFDAGGKIFYSSQQDEIGKFADMKSAACIGCHAVSLNPVSTLANEKQWTIYRSKEGHRVLMLVDPIYNEPSCSTAACHVHPQIRKVLGVLVTDFSLLSADKNVGKLMLATTVYASIFVIISAVILYFILRKLIIRPVSILSCAMEKVSKGDLLQEVSADADDEMGVLTGAFNTMTKELKTARERMENWTQLLEEEVARKTGELRKSQDKLIQAEKLAALGRLTADVAHEIRNPLTALGGFARRLDKIVTGEKEKELTGILISEAGRLEKILKNVLAFSKDARFHLEKYDLPEIVRELLDACESSCAGRSIEVKLEEDDKLPQVLAYRDQIKQAINNIIINAIDAMPGGGVLTINTAVENLHEVPYVVLKISDTGPGIPEEKLPLIFEPFFSTKEIGRGTGLGLPIAKKLVELHGGFIKAESTPGKGSTFSLYFPVPEDADSLPNCWEFMHCGADKEGGPQCPAHPYFGRACWVVAGTFCEGKVQGTFAKKYENCLKCEYYKSMRKNKI